MSTELFWKVMQKDQAWHHDAPESEVVLQQTRQQQNMEVIKKQTHDIHIESGS